MGVGTSVQSTGPGKSDGFTLTEVIIVVFIIALMSSVVIMNLPEPRPGAVTQADGLVRDLKRASREAIVSGEPVALAVRGGQYRFERYRGGFWTPAGVRNRADLNSEPIVISVSRTDETRSRARARTDDRERNETPADFERSLVFSPVGDVTPAQIIVTGGVHRIGIDISVSGEIARFDASRIAAVTP